jgi:hypothetical protein
LKANQDLIQIMSNIYELRLPLAKLCRRLGVSQMRVEQWVSGGLIEPECSVDQDLATEWTFGDAMRLAILVDIDNAGLPLGKLASHLRWIKSAAESEYFVIKYGLVELVPATPRGGPGTKVGEGPKALWPGLIQVDIVSKWELVDAMSSADNRVLLVVPLDQVISRVKSIWEHSVRGDASIELV